MSKKRKLSDMDIMPSTTIKKDEPVKAKGINPEAKKKENFISMVLPLELLDSKYISYLAKKQKTSKAKVISQLITDLRKNDKTITDNELNKYY